MGLFQTDTFPQSLQLLLKELDLLLNFREGFELFTGHGSAS